MTQASPIPDARGQQPADVHPAFEWCRSESVESLNLVVQEYRHRSTGAMHYHLAADNDENVFMVALRTVPTDSTGVAHILEHTVLCGSERFPVRDPFFMMIRRSLNTFMNAFTSSDWTAYPFASKNRKDFDNLLQVYLDAVFFSRLHELDFAQEGHRVEFAEPDDASSELVYKGVVFNEMKGAMSSPVRTLWQTFSSYLYPTTTYHFNSGGDPEHITDLDHSQLRAFYETHYHPSNAVFMTYGDIPASAHHARMEELALSRFAPLGRVTRVHDEKRYHAPLAVESNYALNEAQDDGDQTHIVLGWLLGPTTDVLGLLKAHLLADVLLDNGACPLRHALETTELGSAPSPLCGLDDSNRELSLICGLEGSRPEHAQALEQLVLEVIADVAEEGLPLERLEAALHQLELSQREISGDYYPYGLSLILDALPAAIHCGDPVAVLNVDRALAELRALIKDPAFIKDLAREWLLENAHRVRLTLKPDAQLDARRQRSEAARLASIKAAMSQDEHAAVVVRAGDLAARQQAEDDVEILPKVGLADIPPDLHIPTGHVDRIGETPLAFYPQGTNGLVYQQIVVQLPHLEDELLDVLPFFTNCMTELGCGERDYVETQAWQYAVSGGINSYTTVRGSIDDVQDVRGYFVLSGKALARNHAALTELLAETLERVRFDEYGRMREIIAQIRARRDQSITGNGHYLAMVAAASGMSPAAALTHRLSGLAGIRAARVLDDALADDAHIKALADKFRAIHTQIVKGARQLLSIGEDDRRATMQEDLARYWAHPAAADAGLAAFALPKTDEQVRQLWSTSTQVNFCAKAYRTVPIDHPDAAALTVLGGFLRNGFLHRTVREQGGAYGGGASHDADIAAFRFYSYRDPRLDETLRDFDRAVEWLADGRHEWRQVEEAILGVIGSIDKPGSPAGDAKQAFHNNLLGRTPDQRTRFRQRVLGVTLEDLRRVGATYLQPANASVAVVSSAAHEPRAGELGLQVHKL